MTCERFERELALYVEADLAPDEAAAVERHLPACQQCRALLRGLEDSQRQLKSLADEPFDDAVLLSLRRRIQAAAANAGPAGWGRHWFWALAASLLALAIGLLLRPALPARSTQAQGAGAVAPAPQPTIGVERPTPVGAGRPDSSPLSWSTVSRDRSVSSGVGSGSRVVPLTAEEAAQLARAVVLVSRTERLPSSAPVPATKPATNVVVLATADPRVVIYWQIDSNGG